MGTCLGMAAGSIGCGSALAATVTAIAPMTSFARRIALIL
jgi:hypothetical protein